MAAAAEVLKKVKQKQSSKRGASQQPRPKVQKKPPATDDQGVNKEPPKKKARRVVDHIFNRDNRREGETHTLAQRLFGSEKGGQERDRNGKQLYLQSKDRNYTADTIRHSTVEELARRGGIVRYSKTVAYAMQALGTIYLEELVRSAGLYAAATEAKTLAPQHVILALRNMNGGDSTYGAAAGDLSTDLEKSYQKGHFNM